MAPKQATEASTLLGHEPKAVKAKSWVHIFLNPSAFEKLQINDGDNEEELGEEGEATDLELFSDLVVVVSIHMLSDLLEEGNEEGEEDVWLWFILRVFYIYALWLQYMEVANLHNLYVSITSRMDPFSYVMIFGFMAILVIISKACQKDQHRLAAIVYIFGRVWGLIVIRIESHLPRTCACDPDQREFFKKYCVINPRYFTFEAVPLIGALIFSWENDTDILWGGLTMIAARIVVRLAIGLKSDFSNNYDIWDGKLIHTDHTQERYKLVTLIFLGELCFTATSVEGNYSSSLSALLTAMGCFVCYFLARVKGRVEAWNRSALCNLQCHTLHLIIFCAVPIMGVGYVGRMKETEAGDVDEVEETDEVRSWYNFPHAILSIAAAVFLSSLGYIEMFTKDPELPEQQVRMKRSLRVLLYFAMGIFLIGIQFSIPFAETYVPLVIAGTGLTLVWGVQIENSST